MAQTLYINPGAKRTLTIDFTKQLATAATPTPEICSSGATVVLNTTDGALTISGVAINSAAIIPPNAEAQVPANQGVSFVCQPGTDGYSYEGRCSVTTN